jgi:hypothetical protein
VVIFVRALISVGNRAIDSARVRVNTGPGWRVSVPHFVGEASAVLDKVSSTAAATLHADLAVTNEAEKELALLHERLRKQWRLKRKWEFVKQILELHNKSSWTCENCRRIHSLELILAVSNIISSAVAHFLTEYHQKNGNEDIPSSATKITEGSFVPSEIHQFGRPDRSVIRKFGNAARLEYL